jgi:ArsR family transcriptional regulator
MKTAQPIAECDPASECCPPDAPEIAAPTSGPAAEAELAALSKALGHPARVRILKLLLSRELCIAGEIADQLPLAASTVSQHLKILKESGLVKGSIDGPRRCYCVDRTLVARLRSLVLDLSFEHLTPGPP